MFTFALLRSASQTRPATGGPYECLYVGDTVSTMCPARVSTLITAWY